MKQMVDYLEEMKSKTTDESEVYMLIDAWVHALYLVELEKVQMHKCASFWRGKENEIEAPIFEQYYNETYRK